MATLDFAEPVAISMRWALSASGTSRLSSIVGPVLEYRAAYLDVLSEVEALAEGAGRNAMVQDLTALAASPCSCGP